MSEYEAKLDQILYVIYRLCKRIRGRVRIEKVVRIIEKNYPDFDISELAGLLKGLEEYDCIKRKIYRNGENKGVITLLSHGIRNAEEYEKKMTPNAGETLKIELEEFLKKCCEAVEFQLKTEFNAVPIGTEMGFDWQKTKLLIDLLEQEDYLGVNTIPTTNNSKSVLTLKAIKDVTGGPLFDNPGATNVTKNEFNITGDGNNSVIAVGDGNTQSLSLTQKHRTEIKEAIEKARAIIPDLDLGTEDLSDYNSHLDALEAVVVDESALPSAPKREFRALKRIMEGAAGNAAGSALYEVVVAGISFIPL